METLSTKFNNTKEQLGPYNVEPYDVPILSRKQFSTLAKEDQERIISDRQSIILFSAAIEDSSKDKTLGKLEIQFHGEKKPLQQLINQGSQLPIEERLSLIKDILNENISYSNPEDDSKVERRPDAPMKDIIDYAQTSRETIESKHGDCEDYAILGADLLQRMGTPLEDIKVLAGSVYDRNGKHQFDHANLAVRISERNWSQLELVNDGVSILGTTSYLQNGLKGELFFVPSVAVGADLSISSFNIDQPKDLPKSRFEKPFTLTPILEKSPSPTTEP